MIYVEGITVFYKIFELEFKNPGLGKMKHYMKWFSIFLNYLIHYKLSSSCQEQQQQEHQRQEAAAAAEVLSAKSVFSVFISKVSRLGFHFPFSYLLCSH